MKTQFRWNWKTFLEKTNPEIGKVTMDDIKNMKPKWITTYCGCKCVKVDPEGGTFVVCSMHEEKFKEKGYGIVIPNVNVDIPVEFWDRIKDMVLNRR